MEVIRHNPNPVFPNAKTGPAKLSRRSVLAGGAALLAPERLLAQDLSSPSPLNTEIKSLIEGIILPRMKYIYAQFNFLPKLRTIHDIYQAIQENPSQLIAEGSEFNIPVDNPNAIAIRNGDNLKVELKDKGLWVHFLGFIAGLASSEESGLKYEDLSEIFNPRTLIETLKVFASEEFQETLIASQESGFKNVDFKKLYKSFMEQRTATKLYNSFAQFPYIQNRLNSQYLVDQFIQYASNNFDQAVLEGFTMENGAPVKREGLNINLGNTDFWTFFFESTYRIAEANQIRSQQSNNAILKKIFSPENISKASQITLNTISYANSVYRRTDSSLLGLVDAGQRYYYPEINKLPEFINL